MSICANTCLYCGVVSHCLFVPTPVFIVVLCPMSASPNQQLSFYDIMFCCLSCADPLSCTIHIFSHFATAFISQKNNIQVEFEYKTRLLEPTMTSSLDNGEIFFPTSNVDLPTGTVPPYSCSAVP